MRKFEDIIERIEYVRQHLGLNKSRFSAEIGMKPQTYNNFIGAQGSKPNIELIYGIVNTYKVNPHWLLNGTGEVFSEGGGAVPGRSPLSGAGFEVGDGESTEIRRQHEASLRELHQQLQTLAPVLQEIETRIRGLEESQVPLINGLAKVLARYLELDPVGATREIRSLLQKLGGRLSRIN